ncbi:nucleoside recognition domain-containing protein [Faecalimonas sp.]
MLIKPNETFVGASEGLLLWYQIILPTLFPFMIITNLLIRTNTMVSFTKWLSPILCPLFSASSNGTFSILTGFLCGYPMGAKVTADLVKNGKISKNEAAYLLSFCNNTSPMFIMNYVILKTLKCDELLFPSLIILFISPILCSFLFRIYYLRKKPFFSQAVSSFSHPYFHFQLLDQTIMNSFEALTKVGGYIVLFSVLTTLLKEIPCTSSVWTICFLPSLEITTGIQMILKTNLPFSFSYICIMTLISFGGFCSIAQTKCMLEGTGLSIYSYTIEKLITAMVTSLLTLLYIHFLI